jgi:Fe-S cluster assembly protein SufD
VSLDRSTLDSLIARDPEWVGERRRAGFKWLEKLDVPTGAEEEWRYVEVPGDPASLPLVGRPGEPIPPDDLDESFTSMAGRAQVVDGTTVAIESDVGAGVLFAPLASAYAEHEAELRGAYLMAVDPGIDRFAAAHAAFAGDGVFLYLPPGVAVAEPFLIDVQGVTAGSVSFPHVTVVAEKNSEASVVIRYRSAPGADLAMIPQVEASVRDGGRLRLTTVQQVDEAATTIAHQRLDLGRDATALLGEVGLGGRFGRLDLGIDLLGSGGTADVVGIYYGEHEQVLDYRLLIDHFGPSTSSKVFLKGAVEDSARSVFTGMVKIEPDAAKTSAFETNRNLVLSDGAKASSVPNLEILCNDVICGHASSVGPLDEDQLYYLESRGLPSDRAARLLVRGFFEEVIARLPHSQLAGPVRSAVNRKFVTAQEEGRV